MSWKSVGEWLTKHGGAGAALVGSLVVGNVPGAIAAGVSMISSATGESVPERALEALQHEPGSLLKLRELAAKENDAIREHIRAMEELRLKDEQAAHKEQQDTIRSGDNSNDEYVRHTRPKMARQSWYVTAGYVVAFEAVKTSGLVAVGASWELAMLLMAPAAAYLGFRSFDKRAKL